MYLVIYLIIIALSIILKFIYKSKEKKVNNREYDSDDEILKRMKETIEKNHTTTTTTTTNNNNNNNNEQNKYIVSNKEKEILNLQEKYNEKISQINNIKNNTKEEIIKEYNNKSIKHLIRNVDIKNAIIYNAILEPKRINYIRKNKRVGNG